MTCGYPVATDCDQRDRQLVTDGADILRVVLIADPVRIRTKTHVSATSSGARVRLFPSNHLLFNILRHRAVPGHEPLGEAALNDLAASYQTGVVEFVSKLPAIGEHDPVCRFLGGTPPTAEDPVGTVPPPPHGEDRRRGVGDFGGSSAQPQAASNRRRSSPSSTCLATRLPGTQDASTT